MKIYQQLGRIAIIGILAISRAPARAASIEGVIEKNVDGDTVWFQPDDEDRKKGDAETRLKIRMVGIDAPETHLSSSQGVVGQGKYGEEASREMERLAPVGSHVTLE